MDSRLEEQGVVGHKDGKTEPSINVEQVPAAVTKEHNLGLKQGLRAYRKAIGWSILLSMAVIMEGYDTILVSQYSAFDLPGA